MNRQWLMWAKLINSIIKNVRLQVLFLNILLYMMRLLFNKHVHSSHAVVHESLVWYHQTQMSRRILWQVPSTTGNQTAITLLRGVKLKKLEGHAMWYWSTDIMNVDFIMDVLSIPVGNAAVLNFPRKCSVNLTLSSLTDYVHIFNHHLSKHCTKHNNSNPFRSYVRPHPTLWFSRSWRFSWSLTFPIQFFYHPHTPQLLFILGGKEVGGLLVIILQF
jgi:hypothetical protein